MFMYYVKVTHFYLGLSMIMGGDYYFLFLFGRVCGLNVYTL